MRRRGLPGIVKRAPRVPRGVLEVARLFSGFPGPWFIAGGWAIDLFLARTTRLHRDVDIAVLRRDHLAFRQHLTGWSFRTADPRRPGRLTPWRAGETLEQRIHEVHLSRLHGAPRRLEVLLDESSGNEWLYRRNPQIRYPLDTFGLRSPGGIPYLAPEIVLLYKAKSPGLRDDADLRETRGRLRGARRAWLRRAIETSHPNSPWLALL